MCFRFACVCCLDFHSECIDFELLIKILNIADYSTAAKMGVVNGRICLIHNGHKFIRYGSNENTRYWRCRQSFKYQCKARLLTRHMNGCEMLKIENDQHDHIALRVLKKEPK